MGNTNKGKRVERHVTVGQLQVDLCSLLYGVAQAIAGEGFSENGPEKESQMEGFSTDCHTVLRLVALSQPLSVLLSFTSR